MLTAGGFLMPQEVNPLLSVVIPTHNRAKILAKVLEALAKQSFPASQFEVIVVMDGPEDATEKMLRGCCVPYRLRWFAPPHLGAPRCRNTGLREAKAPVCVFIDDDIVSTPGFLEAHYAAHQKEPHLVVLGALKPSPDSPGGIAEVAADWVQGYFDRCSDPTYQVGGKDLVNPNFSAEKREILSVGGWDETFVGYGGPDDRDLGLRLERAGMNFRFAIQALGYHNQTKGWAGVLRDVRQNGRTFAHYIEKHPEGLVLASWAASTAWRRFLFHAIRICPEFAFKALSAFARLTDRVVGDKRRGGALESLVRLSQNVVFVRGIWETPEAAKRVYRMLTTRARGTVGTGTQTG